MAKSDQIMEALTKALENKGVLVETTDNNLTAFEILKHGGVKAYKDKAKA